MSPRSASADENYKGKLFHLLIGYGSGGGYDVYGRLLARHLSDHIPGHPTIIPQNMPGAASLTLLRYLDTRAPADGTYAILFDFVQIVHSLIGEQMMARIDGMDESESDELLEELLSYAEDPAIRYEHVWRPCDFIAWDNLCSSHARTDFSAAERRLFLRGVIEGASRPSAN